MIVLFMVLVPLSSKGKHFSLLREDALSALWHVRTRRVLPQLLLFAEKGYSSALYMIRPMLQTPEEIEQGIAIAQKYIGAKVYALREAALFLLQKHSTMEKEAERILVAVQQYKDELFIDALKEAPAELVLEPLKALRSSIEARFERLVLLLMEIYRQPSRPLSKEGKVDDILEIVSNITQKTMNNSNDEFYSQSYEGAKEWK